jgi:hypothetical protein
MKAKGMVEKPIKLMEYLNKILKNQPVALVRICTISPEPLMISPSPP